MSKLIFSILSIFNVLYCFSQDLTKLVTKEFFKEISNLAYAEIKNCDPDTTYDYMEIYYVGMPHEHAKITDLFCNGLRIRINPAMGDIEYQNITDVYVESKQLVFLRSYFNTQYRIEDFEKIKPLYKGEFYGKKVNLIAKNVRINLKKTKGVYRIKCIKIFKPDK